jgi:hypothetical protein
MGSEQFPNDDFELLLLSVIDDEASDEERASLMAALRESDALRRRACLFLCDESLLIDEIGTTQQVSKLMEVLSSPNRSGQASFGHQPAMLGASKSLPLAVLSYVNRHGLAIAAMAAFVIFGLLAHNMSMMAKVSRLHALVVQGDSESKVEVVVEQESEGEERTRARVLGEVVGRVIGLNDVRWEPGATEFTHGDSLEEGQTIEIASGGLEILLTNGAKVTAAGPVSFELSSLLEMDLDKGKIVAAVPRTARGYTIITPTSELVDVGTQFGVAVADSGDTELHVFDGDVMARSRVNEASAELVHAKENEAIRFDSESPELQRFAAQESSFVRRLGPNISTSELPRLPQIKDLCLWYAADMIRDVNAGDPVSVWRDILVGDNKFANDARQFDSRRYPELITDDQGRKSLKFDGWSTSLQIDPLDNSGRYTIFVVCAPGPSSFENKLGMLLKHGESPSLEMSVLPDLAARSWVWPGHGQNNVGIVQSSPIRDSQISVVACRYDSRASHSQLWVNGVSQQESDAPVDLRPCAQAFLGSHSDPNIGAYFFGNIYEVVIYDGNLAAEAMDDMNSYFSDRYIIEKDL